MRRRRTVFALAFVAVTAALLWPRVSVTVPHPELPWDKAVHLVMFAALGALGVWARIPWAALAGLLVAQAAVSEVLQGWLLPDRSGDPIDLAYDLGGVAAGIGIALLVRRTTVAGDAAPPP